MKTNFQNRISIGQTPFSRVRSVSQVLLTFRSSDPKKTFVEIRKEALQWLANRAGRRLPNHAWDGESFDMLEVGAQPVSAVSLEHPMRWCCRISDADKQVPQRSWTTECGVVLDVNGGVLFGCRLQCVALGDSPQFDATIPGVVRQLVGKHNAHLDGRPITLKASHVATEGEVEALVDLLLDSRRQRPVVAVSLGGKDGQDGRGVINADNLANLSVGAAHVVTLTGDASYKLTDRLGKEFSVFHQAVRTYRPGLNVDEDSTGDHPIALPHRVDEWSDGGPEAFMRFLVERTLRDTVVGVDIYRPLPSFSDIHAQALKQKRDKAGKQGASDKDLLALTLEENDSINRELREEKDTYNSFLQLAEVDRRQIESERDQARTEVRSLQARLMHIEAALQATGKQEDIPIPDSFEGLEDWCRVFLSGKVHVMSRACRIATKSTFSDLELAYRTLLILRDHYVPMRSEVGLERKRAYEQALAALGLEESQSFAGTRAGEEGDEYKVTYNGRPKTLDRHIKRSNSREERFGFRLYFFWDIDRQQAVVGSFPTHLTTRAT
ncbi:MAG: hypothetical protein ACSLE5_14560 [Porticoccaceae bacterium]